MLIVYDWKKRKASAIRRLEYSPAVKLTGDTPGASQVAMLSNYASDRSWSAETTTFFPRRRVLNQRGQGSASALSMAPLKNAQDYFITKRSGFPWSTIPDFVVGRAGVDNWLMVTALARRAAVVDASGTITARHQVRAGYEPSAHFTQPAGDASANYALAGRSFDYSLGLTDCAPLETAPASLTTAGQQHTNDCDRTIVLRRREFSRYCRRAYVKLRGLRRLSRGNIDSHRNITE